MPSKRRRIAAAAAVAAVAAVALTAACGTATDDPTADPTNAAAPTTGGPSGAGVADPQHAMDPPGPREGAALGDDILIVAPEAIPDDIVEEIGALDGVLALDQFSMGNVETDNKVLNIAAVDPATYRNFTPTESADLQEQWDRVAGGEMAVVPEEKKQLPLDDDGYLAVGSGGTNSAVHVGAYAPQVGGIDAVVNSTWVDTLGLPEGNALVLQTGSTPPQELRKPIEEILDGVASVQDLDSVAETGIDPKAKLLVQFVGTFADAVGTFNYTVTAGGGIAPDPAWVRSHIETQTVPIIGEMTCNSSMFPQLQAAFREIVERGLADEIHPDEYAGCYVPKLIAGSTSLSNHTFGLAFDINVPGNLRGTVGEIDRGVVDIFKKWGFAWGGDWSYTDPMHFELERLVRPGGTG